jgi:hypothetical protein
LLAFHKFMLIREVHSVVCDWVCSAPPFIPSFFCGRCLCRRLFAANGSTVLNTKKKIYFMRDNHLDIISNGMAIAMKIQCDSAYKIA